MSDQVGTREQSSDPPRTEYGYLAVGVAAFTAAVILSVVDETSTTVDFSHGIYGILFGLSFIGGVGWIVRSGDTKRRKALRETWARLRGGQVEVRDQLATLAEQVAALTEQVAQSRVTYLPPQPCRAQGHMYVSQAASGDGDTVPLMPKMDRPGVADRDAAIEEGFELGYRARDAEAKTTRLPVARSRLIRDS